MNIPALKLILKHLRKLPEGSFNGTRWIKVPEGATYHHDIDGASPKEFRQLLVSSGYEFSAIGWAALFSSMLPLRLVFKDNDINPSFDGSVDREAVAKFLDLADEQVSFLFFGHGYDIQSQIMTLKDFIKEHDTTIDVERIKEVVGDKFNIDDNSIKLVMKEVKKLKTVAFDGVLLVDEHFEDMMSRSTVQYGRIIGDKKQRFDDDTSIHTSSINRVDSISNGVKLLHTRNSTYLEIKIG